MKNLINYYFGFHIDNIRLIHNKYYFLHNNQQYIFTSIDINRVDINNVFRFNMLLRNYNSLFHEIIPNKDNMVTTMVENEYYVLLKINIDVNKFIDLYDIVDFMFPIRLKGQLLDIFNQSDWVNLWKNKIDYFEHYTNNIENNSPFINELINYYVGLGENAISYVADTMDKFNASNNELVVSHRRIDYDYTLFDLYNPLSITIDYRARDIAEYFKGLFLKGKYSIEDISKCIKLLHFNELDYRLLFGRMLFPSFFFDNYELFVMGHLEEKSFLKMVNRVEEYEKFLKEIYIIISDLVYIPFVEWLKNVDV